MKSVIKRTNIWVSLGVLIAITYVAFLLVNNYQSQTRAIVSAEKRLVYALEKQALPVSHFLSDRRRDLSELTAAKEVWSYFENKALGMSLQYGLKTSLFEIENLLQRLVDNRKIGEDQIYEWLGFITPTGEQLRGVYRSENRPDKSFFDKISKLSQNDLTVTIENFGESVHIITAAPYFFKGTFKGHIAADVLLNSVLDNLGSPTGKGQSSTTYLFCPEKSALFPDGEGELSGWISDQLDQEDSDTGILKLQSKQFDVNLAFLIYARIAKSHLFLIDTISEKDLSGGLRPADTMVAMVMLSMVIFGGLGLLVWNNTKTRLLNVKFEESNKRAVLLTKHNEKLLSEITERVKSEKKLRASEEKYRALVENLPDVIFSIGNDWIIENIHLSDSQSYGFLAENILGTSVSQFIHEDDFLEVRKVTDKDISTRRHYRRGLKFRVVSQDGSLNWAELNLHYQYDNDGQLVKADGVLRDITANKELENQLIRSERLAAAGQLAASIAHEVNSPLSGITALLGVVKKNHQHDKETLSHIDLIQGALKNIGKTVNNLLELNRPGSNRPLKTNINVIINATVDVSRMYLQKKGVEVEVDLDPTTPEFECHPQEIGQVLLNLINNSVEAMDGDELSGTPQNTISRSERKTRKITIKSIATTDKIIVEHRDTGPGIEAGQIEKIFDPFYTSKVTFGMGLGLSLCHEIVAGHKGSIQAISSEQGAFFLLELPVAPPEEGLKPLPNTIQDKENIRA